jgi:hypothetical protein
VSVLAPRRVRAGEVERGTALDRVFTALPLLSIYLWLCIIYCVEAWKRVTPTLFTDELEMTQIARSIADTGHPARRGQPYTFHSLYPVVTAPVWWIHDVATAFAVLKYVDVIVMTSAVFPTYFLARIVVGRVPALFAAAGAGAIPALAYSTWIVEETLAYPYAALCLFLLTKAFVVRRRGWIAAATAAAVLAPAVRSELAVIPGAAVLALLFAFFSSAEGRAWWRRWSIGDWIGFLTLIVGVIIFLSAIGSHVSSAWYAVTQFYKRRLIDYGNWAAGAFAIGIGFLPLIGGLAALVPPRGERPSREVRMFRCVSIAAIIAFATYSGFKAAYLSTVFETRIVERNIIYIAPLLFVGTALVLERRRVHPLALAAAVAYALYLVVGTPFRMDVQLYSDALGLAVLQQANRYYEWTPDMAQWLLLAIVIAGTVLFYAMTRISSRLALGVAVVLGASMLAWNVTAEIAAGAGTVSWSRDTVPTLKRPFTWVDDVAGGKPTIYLAQGVADSNPEWLLEFWNRSIRTVSSLDGTLGGPGPSGAPNTTATGQIYSTHDPKNPGPYYDYAVEDWPCVDFAGTLAAKHFYRSGSIRPGEWRLIQLTKPNRLRAECIGIYPDGWTGANDSTYYRFSGKRPGTLVISISRQSYPATPVKIQVTDIAERHYTVAPGRVRRVVHTTVHSIVPRTIRLRVPASGFAVRVVVQKKFIPRDVDPANSHDPRLLGALVSYRFVPDAATK